MKKKFICYYIIISLLITLTSCASDKQNHSDISNFPETDKKSDTSYSLETDETSEYIYYIPKSDEYEVSIENRYIYGFSSGLSWIYYVYSDSSDKYVGCIDKNGNLLFSFEEQYISKYSSFENGAAYISDKLGNYYIINESGDVLISSINNEFERIISCGDGYFLAYKNVERFDSDEYLFLIINNSGKIVKEISSKDCTQVSWEDFNTVVNYEGGTYNNIASYCGEGIFQFMVSDKYVKSTSSTNKTKCSYLFYDINKDDFIEKECNYLLPNQLAEFDNGLCVLEVEGKPVLFDIDSQTDNFEDIINIENTHNIKFTSCNPVINGNAIYYYDKKSNDTFFGHAYADKTGIHLIDAYCEYDWKGQFDQNGNRILIQFTGKDGNDYMAIIDKTAIPSWNRKNVTQAIVPESENITILFYAKDFILEQKII